MAVQIGGIVMSLVRQTNKKWRKVGKETGGSRREERGEGRENKAKQSKEAI